MHDQIDGHTESPQQRDAEAAATTEADAELVVPTSPQVAPGIWLVGHLHESALEEPPWCVERAGDGFIQMGELAYRIAEQANGEQSVGEIAVAVSAALGRTVSARDVTAVISTILIPRGVIAASGVQPDHAELDDSPGDPGQETRGRWRRGAGRRMDFVRGSQRELVIGPKALEAVASVLMWLYWPPVMVVMALSSLGGLLWLFLVHGLAAAVMQVLSVPVLVFPLALATGLVLLAQKIGPMVSLYSAGARIERVHVVPSLLRPRFRVDITDDYGLSRWTRLVVNLSGVYLQLVLALVLCLVAGILGAEFLFLAVTLVTLTMLRSLLPFGRRDADRLLADWLLVERPMRYVEQVLAPYVAGTPMSAPLLPRLKRRGRITIGVHLGLAMAVLLIGGLILLWALPPLLASVAWALVAHLAAVSDAIGARDVVGVLGSLIQSAILLLATFVGAVLFVVHARGILVGTWTWSQTSRRHRLLAGLGALLMIVVLLVVWVPTSVPGLSAASASETPRSLVGVTFQPLTQASRGTIFDLF